MTMVTFRIYQFECDAPGCEAISEEYGPGVAADARAQAEREGWTRDGREDYCPRHAAPLGSSRVSVSCPDCGRTIVVPKGATAASHGGQCRRPGQGLTVNPDPVAVVDRRHIGAAYKGVTRADRRAAWIATGNDPALFDAENPEPAKA